MPPTRDDDQYGEVPMLEGVDQVFLSAADAERTRRAVQCTRTRTRSDGGEDQDKEQEQELEQDLSDIEADGSLPDSIVEAARERYEDALGEATGWEWSITPIHHYQWRTAEDDDMALERVTVDYRVER